MEEDEFDIILKVLPYINKTNNRVMFKTNHLK